MLEGSLKKKELTEIEILLEKKKIQSVKAIEVNKSFL